MADTFRTANGGARFHQNGNPMEQRLDILPMSKADREFWESRAGKAKPNRYSVLGAMLGLLAAGLAVLAVFYAGEALWMMGVGR